MSDDYCSCVSRSTSSLGCVCARCAGGVLSRDREVAMGARSLCFDQRRAFHMLWRMCVSGGPYAWRDSFIRRPLSQSARFHIGIGSFYVCGCATAQDHIGRCIRDCESWFWQKRVRTTFRNRPNVRNRISFARRRRDSWIMRSEHRRDRAGIVVRVNSFCVWAARHPVRAPVPITTRRG